MLKRAIQFVMNREWVLALSFVSAALLGIQEAAEILPEDAEGFIMGGTTIALGWVARARVWSGTSVEAISASAPAE